MTIVVASILFVVLVTGAFAPLFQGYMEKNDLIKKP